METTTRNLSYRWQYCDHKRNGFGSKPEPQESGRPRAKPLALRNVSLKKNIYS